MVTFSLYIYGNVLMPMYLIRHDCTLALFYNTTSSLSTTREKVSEVKIEKKK